MSIEFCNTCGEPPYEPIYLVGEVFCRDCLKKRIGRWRTIEAHAKALIATGIDNGSLEWFALKQILEEQI